MRRQPAALSSLASMAGMFCRFNYFVLFVFVCFCKASLDRRFSNYKRCADDECSMLLCRGKAAKDFSGPDCRFLSFKKGETVYVYYKLSGQRSDVWAGSVGSSFGYFPKDYLNINHIYTEKEIEVSTEETDFVCFDTGLDKFTSYNIDVLLSNSLLLNEDDSPGENLEDSKDGEINAKDVENSEEESPKDIVEEDSELLSEEYEDDEGEVLEDVNNLEPPELSQLPLETTASDPTHEESSIVKSASESDDADSSLKPTLTKDKPDEPLLKSDVALDKSDHITEVESQPELKTTLGSTFDAVISDDKETQRVSPDFKETESSKIVDQPIEQEEDVPKEPALLLAAEELPYVNDNPTESKDEDVPVEPVVEKQEAATEATKNENVWSSLGDTVFNIVSGGERTVLPEDAEGDSNEDDDEDEEDDDEEEDEEGTINTEQSEKHSDQLNILSSDINKESDKVTHIHEESKTETPVSTNTETKQPNNDLKDEKPVPSPDSKESETKQSNNDLKVEEPILSTESKISESKQSNNDLKVEEPILSTESKISETKFSNIDPKVEESVLITESRISESKQSNNDPKVEELISLTESKESETKQSNIDLKVEEPILSTESKASETKLSNNDPNVEELISLTESKESESKPSNNDLKVEESVLSAESKVSETKVSDINPKVEEPISLTEIKESESKQSNIDLKVKEPISSPESETKLSLHDTKTEDPVSFSDTKPIEASEHDPKTLKHESTENTDLSKKPSDVEESLNDAVVNSEHDPPASNTEEDTPVENTAEKSVEKTSAGEEVKKSQYISDKTLNAAELDEKKDEVKPEDTVKEQPEQESEDDDDEEGIVYEDEQIDRVKNDMVNLLHSTLKAEEEKADDEEPEVFEENEEIEELLEDENALLSSKTELTEKADEVEESENIKHEPELETVELVEAEEEKENLMQTDEETESNTGPSLDSPNDKDAEIKSTEDGADDSDTSEEPQYSDSVLRLSLLRDHFKDDEMTRIQKYLNLKDLLKVEAMFTDLEQELKSVKESSSDTSDDIERTLENILEVSENSILDEIEKMLDAREQKVRDLGHQVDPVMFDEEAAILDDFQELAFYLRQKYSAVSDSVPLMEENQEDKSHIEMENQTASEVMEDLDKQTPVTEASETPDLHEETEDLSNVNVNEAETRAQDMGLEEDGGHFNKNKDIQSSFKETEDVQRGPQAILENPLDIALGFEVDGSSGSLESPSASDLIDNKANYDQASTSTSDHIWDWLVLGSEYFGIYSEMLISALPEEWRPGPTFHGLPWKPVVVTAAVGILTVLMFIWRTVLAVKSRTYILTEKQLSEKIQQLVNEKSDVLQKITELNNMIKEHEEKLKNSEKSKSSTEHEFKGLKARYKELQSQREEMSVNISQLSQKIAGTQEENKTLNEKVVTMHQRIEKHQNTLKQYEDERSKIKVLMDEAKLREDALKAQVLSFEKDNSALKDQKKSLLRDAKDWQEKHGRLSEEIKVYHKKQKELEDSLVHKENEIDVLSSCIAELKGLDVCDGTDLQKGDAKLANGEAAEKKGDPIKQRIKQMMDVSRIKATLSVIEEERNRHFENFLTEQKSRQELEEQFQKVVHDQTNLKNEKTHLESQYKNLQQRLEITTELYQQKENALQQKLTQEELERREKETKLSEVDGRAVEAEEELSSLRQKVKDMQDEMQQNERALKAEIAVQEKKAHENWLKARASERALIEERRESANLRQKIVECSDKMSDLEHTLYKSGPPERHMAPHRRGDSFGPSPVSGGAPSPPLMIEGPGRPPSAPVGRRNESFGPRPPSDPHGRFSDLGHPLPSRPEMFAPRTSSPCTQDGSFQLSKSQSQGSFLPSPIRDSPGPTSNAPPKAYGPPPMGGPLPPPSNGPHPLMIRPPNGHHPMMPPGPPLGPDPRFRPPHMDSYGPPPLRPYGPIPPPFVRGPPPRDMPPMGLPPPPFARDFPPDFSGPRDLPFPARPFPPGSLPPPGTMVQPPFIPRDLRGPTPPVAHSFRDGEMGTGHATDGPPQPAHDTPTSTMAEP